MEISCNRCHQPVPNQSCYCPACGLPQLVYASEEGEGGPAQTDRWTEAVRDASQVEWKRALRASIALAIPVGLLCGFMPVAILGMIAVGAAAAWAVSLYVRHQEPPWITMSAGARIGLVTGLIAGWLAFGAAGAGLYAERYVFHQGSEMDRIWKMQLEESDQIVQRVTSQWGVYDAAQAQAQKQFELSPEGHAGVVLFGMMATVVALLLSAMAGGAIGARMMARSRRPEA
jgi:hypothetical protein